MRKRLPLAALAAPALGLLSIGLLADVATAQDWSPFDPFKNPARGPARQAPTQERAPGSPAGGTDGVIRPLGDSASSAVERGDLAPVMADDGSGLPYELWRGLDVRTLERLISEIDIPPRSSALHQLWLRLITSNVTPPEGGVTDQQFLALRLEVLYRSGLLEDAARALSAMPAGDATVAILAARNEIGLGAQDRGCETMKAGGGAPAQLPQPVKADAALISGFCAALPAMLRAPDWPPSWRAKRVSKNARGYRRSMPWRWASSRNSRPTKPSRCSTTGSSRPRGALSMRRTS